MYVHCNGGKGRSAVCTLAYLVSQVELGLGLGFGLGIGFGLGLGLGLGVGLGFVLAR